jgi:hypothetical protein
MNTATKMKNNKHLCLTVYVGTQFHFGRSYVARSESVMSYGNSTFNFLNCKIFFFQSGCIILHSHLKWLGLWFPTFSSTLVLTWFGVFCLFIQTFYWLWSSISVVLISISLILMMLDIFLCGINHFHIFLGKMFFGMSIIKLGFIFIIGL